MMTPDIPAEAQGGSEACERACDYCQPDAWHDCTLPAGHGGYHSCTGYTTPPTPGNADD